MLSEAAPQLQMDYHQLRVVVAVSLVAAVVVEPIAAVVVEEAVDVVVVVV